MLLACSSKDVNERDIGTYRGFNLKLVYDSFHQFHVLSLVRNAVHKVEVGSSELGNITRIDNAIEGISKRLDNEKRLLDETLTQYKNAKEELERPFEKEEELNEKMKQLSQLNKELDIGNKDETAVFIDDDIEASSLKSKTMER